MTEYSCRVFTPVRPPQADIERAKALPAGSCPRRYCWWWHSLGFDWDTPVEKGCTFLSSEKPPDWPNAECPCKRAEPASTIDHFEPREPHLIEDGLAPVWLGGA